MSSCLHCFQQEICCHRCLCSSVNTCLYALTTFNFFFYHWFWTIWFEIPWCIIFFYVSYAWNLLRFLNLWVYILKIKFGSFSCYFYRYFFLCPPPHSCENSDYTYIRLLEAVIQFINTFFILFNWFSFISDSFYYYVFKFTNLFLCHA